MIIDVTGVELVPGEEGWDCPGNGMHIDVECCCDECDYLLCCLEPHDPKRCVVCQDEDCPRSPKNDPEFVDKLRRAGQ
ncbi:MAG: hypothetical protein IJW45_06340 [Oscillospiraceae bacterium]|nr:hypothetical protein [Oscillospiraceae bacterium]